VPRVSGFGAAVTRGVPRRVVSRGVDRRAIVDARAVGRGAVRDRAIPRRIDDRDVTPGGVARDAIARRARIADGEIIEAPDAGTSGACERHGDNNGVPKGS